MTPRKRPKKTYFGIRLPDPLAKKVSLQAKKEGISVSEMIRQILVRWVA